MKQTEHSVENCGDCPFAHQVADIAGDVDPTCVHLGAPKDNMLPTDEWGVPEWCPLINGPTLVYLHPSFGKPIR